MISALRNFGASLFNGFNRQLCTNKLSYSNFSSYMNLSKSLMQSTVNKNANFLSNSLSRSLLEPSCNSLCLSRNVTKFSLKTGKKKSNSMIPVKFYRLHNGLWIRRIAGHSKKVHLKNCHEKYRARQHVFCTRAQCIMFDKMITDYHKKRRYFIDDPFEPYHDRHNIDYYVERRKWVNLKKPDFKDIDIKL